MEVKIVLDESALREDDPTGSVGWKRTMVRDVGMRSDLRASFHAVVHYAHDNWQPFLFILEDPIPASRGSLVCRSEKRFRVDIDGERGVTSYRF